MVAQRIALYANAWVLTSGLVALSGLEARDASSHIHLTAGMVPGLVLKLDPFRIAAAQLPFRGGPLSPWGRRAASLRARSITR